MAAVVVDTTGESSDKEILRVVDEFQAYLGTADAEVKQDEPTRLPLAFKSLEQEINFLGIVAALDFGRGFEKEFVEDTGRGFDDTSKFGVMHMHISGKELDADLLCTFNAFSVSEHFGLKSVQVEEEVVTGACYKLVDGPLKPYANLVEKVMQNIGKTTKSLGKTSLGTFIVSKLKSAGMTAQTLVNSLGSTYEAFHDTNGGNRKAVQLVRNLYNRFAQEPTLVDYVTVLSDVESLPVNVDAALVLAASNAKLIKSELIPVPRTELDLLKSDDSSIEAKARLETLEACKAILAKVQSAATSCQLDRFLRARYGSNEHPRVINTSNY